MMSDYRILFGQYDTCVRINVNAWKCSQMIYRQRANADCIYTIHVDLHTLIYTHVWITIKKLKTVLHDGFCTHPACQWRLISTRWTCNPHRLTSLQSGDCFGLGVVKMLAGGEATAWGVNPRIPIGWCDVFLCFFFPDAGCNCWLMGRAFFFSSSLLRIKIATKINGSLLCFVFWSELLKCGSWISRGRSALSGSGRPEVLMVGLVLLLNQLLGLWRGPWQPWQMPCL